MQLQQQIAVITPLLGTNIVVTRSHSNECCTALADVLFRYLLIEDRGDTRLCSL